MGPLSLKFASPTAMIFVSLPPPCDRKNVWVLTASPPQKAMGYISLGSKLQVFGECLTQPHPRPLSQNPLRGQKPDLIVPVL